MGPPRPFWCAKVTDLLTVAEAASALRLGSTKTRELIATGRLRVARIDRRVLVPADSISEFLAEHMVGGPTGQDSAATGSTPAREDRRARVGRR